MTSGAAWWIPAAEALGWFAGPAEQAIQLALRQELGWRWGLSGRLAPCTWLGLVDQQGRRRLEATAAGAPSNSRQRISPLLFGLSLERYGLKTLPYCWAGAERCAVEGFP